jgi:hypothetical protein
MRVSAESAAMSSAFAKAASTFWMSLEDAIQMAVRH